MLRFDFWLHMDGDYMWRWLCYKDGKPIAMSPLHYFNVEDARASLNDALNTWALEAA